MQVAELRVDLTGGNPLPTGGIRFGDPSSAPERIVLENGDAQQVDYFIGAEGTEITIDDRIIRIAAWQHREVEDNLDAERRHVRLLDEASHWQFGSDPDDPQHIRLEETGSEHATTIAVPLNTKELTFQVAADSQVVIGDSIAGLPDRTNIAFRLGEANRVDLQLADTWRFVQRGLTDGARFYRVSDGSKEIVTFADGDAWCNPLEPFDVTGDASVSPRDALFVIAELNRSGARSLTAPPKLDPGAYFFDVNQDHFLSPIDALLVIEHLNNLTGPDGEEGEGVFAPQGTEFADPLIGTVSSSDSLVLRDDVATPVKVAPKETSLPTYLTGLAPSEALQEVRLWGEGHTNWIDEDLEEILAQFAEEDGPWLDQ